jgi:predicted Zn-dependent protease
MSDDRIKMFEEVLAMDPDDAVVRYGLGQALMDLDRHGEAVPHLQEAIRVKPDYSVCYHLLGLCLEQTGEPKGALEIYDQGIRVAREQGDLHVVNLIEERKRAMEGGG